MFYIVTQSIILQYLLEVSPMDLKLSVLFWVLEVHIGVAEDFL